MSRRSEPPPRPGAEARRVAAEALVRIEQDDAYANLALGSVLDRSGLAPADRALVTDVVYGVLRRRRSLDHLVDRYLTTGPPLPTRTALRIGAYQLLEERIPPHAAVSTAVDAAPARHRGLVNAVLRKVAAEGTAGARTWPDDPTRLSYPDWLVDLTIADLGPDDGIAALEAMNLAPEVTTRADGYVQDAASQELVEGIAALAGEGGRLAGIVGFDLCAAPGGKATALAALGASVVAMDHRPSRTRLLAGNVARLGAGVGVVTGDAVQPPMRSAIADVVLVDAPCSGLGVLRRRPDARWRLEPDAIARLAALQTRILVAAADLVAPGGHLVYSVCTFTRAETLDVAEAVDAALGVAGVGAGWEHSPLRPAGWRALGEGALVLPQDRGTDAMAGFAWRRSAGVDEHG